MASDYLAVVIFILISLFMPASMLLTSVLLRYTGSSNPVKRSNFESAEASFGARLSIMREYLHYFSMFLGYEIVAVMVVLWVFVAKGLPNLYSYMILGLAVFAFALELFVMFVAKSEERFVYG